MDTNSIVEMVRKAHENWGSLNLTMIWVAVIQALALILAAWTTVLARTIKKDVNSDRTARIIEVQELQKVIVGLHRDNAILTEQADSKRSVQ